MRIINCIFACALCAFSYLSLTSCSGGPGTKFTTDSTKKAAWVDPRKGKIWSKVNIVQIPLTAYENHILGKVRTVSYKDYNLSQNPDSSKILDDSGYNVYDRFGHLIDQNEYKADGTPKWKCIYKYDDKNKAVEWDFNFGNRKDRERITFKYDDKGNEIEQDTYDTVGALVGKEIKKYDDKGNESVIENYDKDNHLKGSEAYKYDQKGNQIEMTESFGDGKSIWRLTCEYDVAGNKIAETNYRSDTGKPSRTVLKNDSLGNILEETDYNPDGTMVRRTTFKYDTWANITEYDSYKKDGSLNEDWSIYSEYVYDAMGNIIKETQYKSKGGKRVPTGMKETTYTYY